MFYWWPLCESNTAPTDSGLCGFHHSLDYTFTISIDLGGCRLVSTRSKCFHTKLRSALPCAFYCRQVSPNLTPSHTKFPIVWHKFYESAALTKHELRGLKLEFASTVLEFLLPQNCGSTVEAIFNCFTTTNLLFLLHFIPYRPYLE